MSFDIIAGPSFVREVKKLRKKYPSLKDDLSELIKILEEDPFTGTPLGQNCYKIRLAIKSKGKGKSGGARVITHLYLKDEKIYLLSIFDKSQKENISDQEIERLINSLVL